MTLLEALTGGAFDRLIWQHNGEFDQNFSKKSNAPGFARGRGGGHGRVKHLWNRRLVRGQPRSQGLSSLPPLVVGIKTLVAAGHVTTQNLGGKKICWIGGVAEYFVC